MAKLRYHRIIIMTDADVDGSHIRTLLLTFFYRQYKEILDNRFLFIAQPPLFKVKKGKKELYLKNEDRLEEYLISSAIEELALVVGPSSQDQASTRRRIEGTELRELSHLSMRYGKALAQLDRRGDSRLLEALVQTSQTGKLGKADLHDEAQTQAAGARIIEYLSRTVPELTEVRFEVKADPEHNGWKLVCPARLGGARKHTVIDFAFFASPEFEEMRELAQAFEARGLGEPPFVLVPIGTTDEELAEAAKTTLGGRPGTAPIGTAIHRLEALYSHIDAAGRKGLQIQRYKGLGEMNAEQLWETTMDPERRTLLEVYAKDVNTAEEVFSTLMGEAVENRKRFIEEHSAFKVRNLDV
jgi:DNA gyrase subunit B